MFSTLLLLLSVVSLGSVLIVWYFILVLKSKALSDRQLKYITKEECIERLERYDKTAMYVTVLGLSTYLLSLEFNAREMSPFWGLLMAFVLAEVYRRLAKQKRGVH